MSTLTIDRATAPAARHRAEGDGPRTWYTSDQHFFHTNILAHCRRPFTDVEEMNAQIVARWNEAVQPQDTVWVLGDVALGPKDIGPVWELNGRKILVAGNHDACWSAHKRHARHIGTYLRVGFDEIVTEGVVRGHALAGGAVVNLAHLPYRGDSRNEDRYPEHRPADDGRALLCGHVHDRWRVEGRQINVGVDVWDFRPVAELVIEDLVDGLESVRPGAS